MSIYNDYIRKYIYGMPGQGTGQGTRGLIGSGGEYGEGVLQGLLGSPSVTSGIGLISAGMRGEGVQEALLKQSQIQQMNIKARRARAFEDLLKRDDISEREKAYLLAGISPPRATTPTLSGEALNVYNKLRVATSKEQFDKIYEGLNQAEKDLYNSKIKPNLDFLGQIKQFEQQQGNKKTSNKSQYKIGQIIEAKGKKYKVVGFDKKGEPQVEEVK
ncbi:MAG: hypothetical protein VW810_03715 [Pelagibacteraceae bacterium]